MSAATARVPYDHTLQLYTRQSNPVECETYKLCNICSTIDFYQISLIDPNSIQVLGEVPGSAQTRGHSLLAPVFEYPSINSLSASGCTLCDEWHKQDFGVVWTNESRPHEKPYIVLTYEPWPATTTDLQPLIKLSSLRILLDENARDTDPMTGLRPVWYNIVVLGSSFSWYRHDGVQPDLNVQSVPDYSWLREELSSHEVDPGLRVRHRQPAGMRLIDCRTHQVIVAPRDAFYLALSYVGGTVPSPLLSTNQDDELPELPLTVRDAMLFAVNLGMRYLWVDRYCVSQDDEQQKHTQLASMGSIYARAWATIVAIAPENKPGLPGVSIPQSEVVCITNPQGMLVNCDVADKAYRDCAWRSRAWTLQEAGLSRQLVFLMSNRATISRHGGIWLDAPSWLPDNNQGAYRRRRNHSFLYYEPLKPGELRPWDPNNCPRYDVVLGNYCDRKLTYENDALNAFRGFLEIMPCPS